MKRKEALRILDANFNRSREGLRVCEELTRFVLEDEALTRALKKVRHGITECLVEFVVPVSELVAARDSRGDVGQKSSSLENKRQNTKALFLANMERAKEALRVLEEVSKLIDPDISIQFKKIRFRVYSIEKETLQKMETLRHHRR